MRLRKANVFVVSYYTISNQDDWDLNTWTILCLSHFIGFIDISITYSFLFFLIVSFSLLDFNVFSFRMKCTQGPKTNMRKKCWNKPKNYFLACFLANPHTLLSFQLGVSGANSLWYDSLFPVFLFFFRVNDYIMHYLNLLSVSQFFHL